VTPEPAAASHLRADVTLKAGESGTLHDTRKPLAVRLRFDELCPGEGVVEVGGGKHPRSLSAAGAVVLQLRPGTQRYRVRCSGDDRSEKPRAAGALTVKLDSGNIPLSRRAPVNVIDADGRRYTVLFQTRLPALTLAWSTAPVGAQHLSLHVDSPAGEREFEAATAKHVLPSGTLPEGTYTWWYATEDGHPSPKTTVTIRFDNAAPTAQFFRASANDAPAAPGAISIDGVTMEGAKVTAAGQPVTVDDRGRFRAAVTPLSGDDAVAVRLEHPRTGVHYYVRRGQTTVAHR
jgi:hypothetical protein